jgi:hypothetical protein
MTGEDSGEESRLDEDPFEKQMRLANETSTVELRVSTSPRYVKSTGGVDERNPIPCICNDKVSQEDIFNIGLGVCQGTLMSTKRTLMSLGCGDSSMVVLHLEAG